jgi:hypothetical protein
MLPDLRNVGPASPPGIYCSNKSSHTNPCTLSFLTLAFSLLIPLFYVHRSSHWLILSASSLNPSYPCPPTNLSAYPARPDILRPPYPCTLSSLPSPYPAPLPHFIPSSTLFMSIVCLIGLSCPLRPLIHLIMATVCLILSCPTRSFWSTLSLSTVPSICLSCPSAPLHPFIHPIPVHCLTHLLILPTASLHPPYPCTLSVPSTYPAPLHLSILLIPVHIHPIHLLCPLHPFILLIRVHYPSHPLILPHCISASFLSMYISIPSTYCAHCIPSSSLSVYTIRPIHLSCPTASLYPPYLCTPSVSFAYLAPLHPFILLMHEHHPSHPFYPTPLRPFIHFIHVRYPSHPIILPPCILSSSLSMSSLIFLRCP